MLGENIFYAVVFFNLVKDNLYASHEIYQDNQDQLLKNNIFDHRQNN